jgi:hypothetical protein
MTEYILGTLSREVRNEHMDQINYCPLLHHVNSQTNGP